MKINLTVELPGELVTEFINHLRAYEAPRSDKVHLNFLVEADSMTAEEVNQMLGKIHPEIPWTRTIPLDKA